MVSIVLLNYKRPENVSELLSRYGRMKDALREVIVCSTPPAELDLKASRRDWLVDMHFVNHNINIGMYVRYITALMARTDIVICVDDDLFLPLSTIWALENAVRRSPDRIHGLFGRIPTADNKYAEYRDHDDCECEMVCGRVTAFHKALLPMFFEAVTSPHIQSLYTQAPKSGEHWSNIEDIIFSYAVRAPHPRRVGAPKNYIHNLEREEMDAPEPVSGHSEHFDYRTAAMRYCQSAFGI
jgi:hypothetical protein